MARFIEFLVKQHKAFLLSLVCFVLSSCTATSLFLVNTLARFDDYSVYQNIPYADHTLNKLDIYIPQKQTDKHSTSPVVIFFYGGCWGGCETRNKEDYTFVAQALTAQGYIVIIPDYRRYPEVTLAGIMQDASHSVEWVKDNIGSYGGNSHKLFLMGHSAGAHIAAMLTLNEEYLQRDTYKSIKGFVGLAGPYDFLPFTKPYQYIVFGPEQKFSESQPVNFVDGTEPPLLLLYGAEDTTVFPRNIKSLAAKVNQKRGAVEVHIYKDIDHYSLLSALSIPYQENQAVLGDIIQFLDNKSVIQQVHAERGHK